jgi:hypothetical protein
MKYSIWAVSIALVGSFNSFGLHSMHCSNADSTLQIQEEQRDSRICVFQGETIEKGKVELSKSSLKQLKGTTGKSGANWSSTYAVQVKFTRTDGAPLSNVKDAVSKAEDYLVCRETSNSIPDLAVPAPNCEFFWVK